MLGQVVYQDPSSSEITDDDVLGLVDEIAGSELGTEVREEPYVLWNDFANMFREGIRKPSIGNNRKPSKRAE